MFFAEQQYDVNADELSNEEAQILYDLLTEINKHLFYGSPNSKLYMYAEISRLFVLPFVGLYFLNLVDQEIFHLMKC